MKTFVPLEIGEMLDRRSRMSPDLRLGTSPHRSVRANDSSRRNFSLSLANVILQTSFAGANHNAA